MKKLLMTIALAASVTMASAQGSIVHGAYENKMVREYPGVSAETLYIRALETLSDWAGTQSKSSINIDVQDKEEGLVVYKGQMYLGTSHRWNAFADFTLKIRCKDGRAQVTVTIPSLTAEFQVDNVSGYIYEGSSIIKNETTSPTINNIVDKITEKTDAVTGGVHQLDDGATQIALG